MSRCDTEGWWEKNMKKIVIATAVAATAIGVGIYPLQSAGIYPFQFL
jgi:hypothetical protein